ncbi:MAG: phosphoribosylformylglycinamidine synthase subunit PurQ, partial [Candidatus Thermoplasmatota archaeon]|nr:phosphoribosylformylglycinamidine synthase subunit PurQ [Candidatus Thermoplasmatota archaeon]
MTSPQELNVAVLRIEGTNCEDEAAAAFSQLGCNTEQVHLKQLLAKAKPHRQLADYDALFIPGGFSAGDYVRAGAIFAARLRAGLHASLDDYINSGAPVLGVC